MGSWIITIKGHGHHENVSVPTDADRMARRFVRELTEAGHTITQADMFCTGSEIDFAKTGGLEDGPCAYSAWVTEGDQIVRSKQHCGRPRGHHGKCQITVTPGVP